MLDSADMKTFKIKPTDPSKKFLKLPINTGYQLFYQLSNQKDCNFDVKLLITICLRLTPSVDNTWYNLFIYLGTY